MFFKLFLLSILTFFAFGCETLTSAPKDLTAVEISFNNQSKSFDNSIDLDLNYFLLADTEVYVANYTEIQSDNTSNFIKKRLSAFLNLFKDELNTYTGLVAYKSRCLVKSTDDVVIFYSGDKNFWSECRLKNNTAAQEKISYRFWKVCKNTVWEITLKSDQAESFKFNCKEQNN